MKKRILVIAVVMLFIVAIFIVIKNAAPKTNKISLPENLAALSGITAGQQAPMSENGVLQFEVDKPQEFYLEAKGANQAWVRNKETTEQFPLVYDADLKLWKGNLVFKTPGLFHLLAYISNSFNESYSREINSVIAIRKPILTTINGEKVNNVLATIYSKDPVSGEFKVWNGLAFGENNPAAIPDGFLAVLPKGEYYIRVEADGYDPVNSLITAVSQQSIVTAEIKLSQPNRFWNKLARIVTTNNESYNFPLQVTPLPQENLLTIGQVMPDIIARDKNKKEVNLFKGLALKPTIIFVYSNWNTTAQEQMDIYTQTATALKDKYNLLNLTTMEPDNINLTQINRGEYTVDFYKPVTKFYDDYNIISLPQFFVLNEKKELLGVITGANSPDELVKRINEIINF